MLVPFWAIRGSIALAGLLTVLAPTLGAGAQSSVGPAGARMGAFDLTADSSTIGPTYVTYANAKMTSANGTTLHADELRANLSKNGSALVNVVLTGHVAAHMDQVDQHRTITVTTDEAVYDPKTSIISLNGGVKTVITSPWTVGPFVQTGDTGSIQLGQGPSYPIIVVRHPHAIFTPKQ